ncbi:MAG: histidinol-phosphate transaminase [Algicola sp.]|nr:histidinol-phosphate transaminase [Algicola sp.]
MSTFDFKTITNPGVLNLGVFPARREPDFSKIIKLDANESLLGPSSMVAQRIKQTIDETNYYPDAGALDLKDALASHLDVAPEQLTLGNGSNDILDIIARVFAGPGDDVVFSQYGFIVYRMASEAVNANPVMVPAKAWGNDLDGMLAAITDKTKIIFLANPNNPTGTWCEKPALEAFLSKVPEHIIVVLDEAYTEYSTDGVLPNGLNYLRDHANLIVTRTFSKAYGLAALRVGFAAASAELTNLLNRVRQPFNVNRLALTGAVAALEDQAHLAETVELTAKGMAQWIEGVNELGLGYIPSRGNFICVDVGDALLVTGALAEQNIFVCPLANYGMPAYVRITIGCKEDNAKVLKALKGLVGS